MAHVKGSAWFMVLPSSNTISSAWFRPFGSRCRCCAQLVHPQRHCQARLDLPHLPHRKPPQLMTVSTFHYVNDVSMFDGIQRMHWCRAQSMQYQVTFYLFFWAVADVIVVVVSRVDCQPLPWRFEWTAALLSQAAVHGSDPTARVLTPSVGQVARSPRQRLADRTRGPGPSEETHPTHASMMVSGLSTGGRDASQSISVTIQGQGKTQQQRQHQARSATKK